MAQEPGLKLRQPIRYGDGAREERDERRETRDERRETRDERREERDERRETRGERSGEGIGKTGVVLTNNKPVHEAREAHEGNRRSWKAGPQRREFCNRPPQWPMRRRRRPVVASRCRPSSSDCRKRTQQNRRLKRRCKTSARKSRDTKAGDSLLVFLPSWPTARSMAKAARQKIN